MKKKKFYLRPDVKVHQVHPTEIICTSLTTPSTDGTEEISNQTPTGGDSYEW